MRYGFGFFLAGILVAATLTIVPSSAHAAHAPADLYFPFTYPLYGTLNSKVGGTHDGYDFNGYGGIGAPIYASHSGRVTNVATGYACSGGQNPNTGYGHVVYISHGNDLETRYAHLNSFAVSNNEWVTTGQLIGYQGNTGHTNCTPHLHFEIKNTATGVWLDVNSQMTSMGFGSAVTAQSPIGFSGAWWFLDNYPGGTGKVAYMGQSGDIPIMGDWDGDGYDTPGFVRYNTATGYLDWFLYNSPTIPSVSGGSTLSVQQTIPSYGDPGDTPIVGDWNGGGADEHGVIRRSGGISYWYLWNAPNWGFGYGAASDNPVAGDWNCDGSDSNGVTRNASGVLRWYLDNDYGGAWDYPAFDWGDTLPAGYDRPTSMRWLTNPACSAPAVIRDGAKNWWLGSGFAGLGSLHTLPASANDFGIPGDWDTDARDDYVVVS